MDGCPLGPEALKSVSLQHQPASISKCEVMNSIFLKLKKGREDSSQNKIRFKDKGCTCVWVGLYLEQK